MVEAEVKQLVENALVIDSLICKELGLAWERPYIPFMEVSGPIQPKKRASQRDKKVSDGAVVPNGENDRDGAATDSREGSVSSTEEWDKMLMETVTELLFDEAVRGCSFTVGQGINTVVTDTFLTQQTRTLTSITQYFEMT